MDKCDRKIENIKQVFKKKDKSPKKTVHKIKKQLKK